MGTTTATDEVLGRVLDELAELRAELARLKTSDSAPAAPHNPADNRNAALSRRRLLGRLASAGAAGAALVVVGDTFAPRAAHAAAGGNFVLGLQNDAGTATTEVHTSIGNGNPAFIVRNNAVGDGIQGFNADAGHSAIHGIGALGPSVWGEIANPSNAQPAVTATTAGTGPGVQSQITNTSNSQSAVTGTTAGTGPGVQAQITNASNSQPALSGTTAGTGPAVQGQIGNSANGLPAVFGNTDGIGPGVQGQVTNSSNSQPGVFGNSGGTGAGVRGFNSGMGSGVEGAISGATNPTAAVLGTTAGTGFGLLGQITNTANTNPAVYATTAGAGAAIEGQITNTANSNAAVYGQTFGAGFGVHGNCQNVGGVGVMGDGDFGTTGVYGHSAFGIGVQGVANQGIGVNALALTAGGIGIKAQGVNAPLLLVPATSTGAPTTGTHAAGEVYVDLKCAVFVCVVASAGGNAGTWRRIAESAPGFDNVAGLNSGTFNFLPSPGRIFDTRNNTGGAGSTPMANGVARDVAVGGIMGGGVVIPATAVAVLGTLTVTQTQNESGSGGYLTAYPNGSPPPAGQETSCINWSSPGQSVATTVVSSLNIANGKFTIKNGIVGGSSSTHVIFDAVAFAL